MQFSTSTEAEKNIADISALWERFESASSQEDYFRSWLVLQCSIIPNAIQGALVIRGTETDSYKPVAKWPAEGKNPECLAEIIERVIEERCGLIIELGKPLEMKNPSILRYGMAYPILLENSLQGVIAVEVTVNSEEQLKSAMNQLHWGIAWLELFLIRRDAKEDRNVLRRLKAAVDLLGVMLAEERFESASMAFVTEMSTQIQCDRVSIGFVHRGSIHVQAISHSAQFGKRMNLIRAIAKAMDEAIIQRREIQYPLSFDSEVLVVREHEQLAKQSGMESILTVPFYGKERCYGAITFERHTVDPFTEDDVKFCQSASALAALILEGKRLNDRLLMLKIADSFKLQLIRLFGSKHILRKIAVLFIIGLAAFFSYATGEYRISADTVIEGVVRRVVVAPFNGYIKESHVRAGDEVKEGMAICTLDDRDLQLEKLDLISERTQLQRQYQKALSEYDRVQVNIINAKLEQTTARLNLVEGRIERTYIRSPFDGIVVSGDLSQRLGGAIEQGEVLFEVSPLNAYRIVLKVDEHRIADVQVGQQGSMLLSALPNEYIDFYVDKITPISSVDEGLNFFRVEASLNKASERLRPGMEGVGKIYVEQRKLIFIWTQSLIEWLRLWVWSWWP